MAVVIPGAGPGARSSSTSGASFLDGSLSLQWTVDSADTPYLTITNGSSGNRLQWTFSGWVQKLRTSLSSTQSEQVINYSNSTTSSSGIEFAGQANGTTYYDKLRFNSFNSGNDMDLWSEARYRDVSGWYHIVESYDSTQETDTNRVKMYVNGEHITDWTAATYPANRWPSQNAEGPFCYAGSPGGYIGAYYWSTAVSSWRSAFNISEYHLIDGAALTADSFGYTDPSTNIWRPKAFDKGDVINDGRSWTDTAVSGVSGWNQALANGFNGSLSNAAEGNTNGETATIALGKTVTVSTGGVGVYAAVTSGNKLTFKLILNGVVQETINLGSSGAKWYFSSSYAGDIDSISIARDSSKPEWNAISINGQILIDSRDTYGVTGFHLPFDGSAPVGQDQSGNGNDWTPVNLSGSVALDKATGALPILNTVNAGNVATVGVRTDSFSPGQLVLAAPLSCDLKDYSDQLNGGSTAKTPTNNGSTCTREQHNYYGASRSFDGSNDYISYANSSDFDFGSGDCTVEAWIYIDTHSSDATIVGTWTGNISWQLNYGVDSSNNKFGFGMYNGTTYTAISDVESTNWIDRWVHVAGQRTGNTLQIWVGGRLAGTASFSGAHNATNAPVQIGGRADSYGFMNGRVQDVRIYKGVAKYTSNFLPGSTDPVIKRSSPSGAVVPTALELPSNVLGYGAAAFDGEGDYITIANSTDYQFGTGDFTVEMWVCPTKLQSNRCFFDTRTGVGGGPVDGFSIVTDGDGQVSTYCGGYLIQSGSVTLDDFRWSHIAVVVNSGTMTLYINGTSVGTNTDGDNFSNGSVRLGSDSGGPSELWHGMMSNVRIAKGTAIYTSNFTPSTEPLTTTSQGASNVGLLCFQNKNDITAAAVTGNSLTASGNASACSTNPWKDEISTVQGVATNYCMWNYIKKENDVLLTEGNLKVFHDNASATWLSVGGTLGVTYVEGENNKWYWENSPLTDVVKMSGWCLDSFPFFDSGAYAGDTTTPSYGYYNNGSKYYNALGTAYAQEYVYGDTIGIAIDLSAGTTNGGIIGFYLNGHYLGDAWTDVDCTQLWIPTTGEWLNSVKGSSRANFGQNPFRFPPKEGFQPICNSSIPQAAPMRVDRVFKALTYAGPSAEKNVDFGFAPDLGWHKVYPAGGNTGGNMVIDRVRDASYTLVANTTAAQTNEKSNWLRFNDYGYVTTGSANAWNGLGERYACYGWKAGGRPKVNDGGAVAFDGTGDYLSLAASTDFDLAGDFCIEAWVYKTTDDNFQTIIDARADTSTGWLLWVNDSGVLKLTLNTARTSEFLASSSNLSNHTWHHVAMVRSGSASNNCKMYLDGVKVAEGTNTTTWDGDATAIGYSVASGHSMSYWRGYMSNLRLVNGSAVYTSAFTPSTSPLTSITNTKLLCCQSPDDTTYAVTKPGTITANGDPSATFGSNFNAFCVNGVASPTAALAGLTAGDTTITGASVGTENGFSIIKYVGPDDTNNHTVAHGLNQAPDFVIAKNLDQTYNWDIWHKELGTDEYLIFTNATPRSQGFNGVPTSTVINTEHDYSTNEGKGYIAYCWHNVPGLQHFGKYIGNATAEGAFCDVGFRPALLWVKNVSGTWDWYCMDNARSPFNAVEDKFNLNQDYVQNTDTATNIFDFTSNGFKVKGSGNTEPTNDDGDTFIYCAWAESAVNSFFGAQANAR